MMRVLQRANAVDEASRALLVEALYTQPSNLAIGALCGIITSLVAALDAHRPVITLVAAMMAVVAVLRVVLAFVLPRQIHDDASSLERIFQLGAYSYALLAGLIAGLVVMFDHHAAIDTLVVGNAITYAVAIAARNAARPLLATVQLSLTLVPVIICVLLRPEPAFRFLGLMLVLMVPAMMSITMNIARVLRDSISAAQTSARLAEKMQHLARTDVVTGLLNRAGLNHLLIEMMMTLTGGQKLALFWLDLDRFKEVNDTLGHQIGDRLLRDIGARLRATVPNDACIARFGGDEFIIACEAASRPVVEDMAHQLLDAVIRPINLDSERLEIGVSIGVAMFPDDGADLEAVMQGADLALYHAKVNGRHQVNFFDPSMTRNLVRRKEIETELRKALQRDELSVFFQPIVDLATGRIRAFEALVRWFHPEKGELYPDEFIPVAEETGAIITLGNWITAQAARVASNWPDDVMLAVNVSPLQIRAPGAAFAILAALRDAHLPPSRLELEITETVLLDHCAESDAFIAELAAAGVRFALDDFGTGYSSLSYLNTYPFSKIKVDRSFVSGVNAGVKSDAIIRAVSTMGAKLGMEIVAEGLETDEQVNAVRDAGCTLGQGYFFSRAVPDYLALMLLAQQSEGTLSIPHRLVG